MNAPDPHFELFALAFVVFWLAICGLISLISGWRTLAGRFRSDESIDGEKFRFSSAGIGRGSLPASYRGCLFLTVGPRGIALSVLFIFRFLHPPLLIPWSAVERCERVKFWFMNCVEATITGSDRRFLFRGDLGSKILEAWTQSR